MAVELNDASLRAFAEIESVGLALGHPNPEFLHVGLVFRDELDNLRLSHLATHRDFRGSDSTSGMSHWVELHLHELLCDELAVYLEHVRDQNVDGNIPYCLTYSGKELDANGKYVEVGIGHGLTCATYVLAVFQANQLPLINAATWPRGRAEDQQWAEKLLKVLEEHHVMSSAEISVERATLDKIVRYRPEEVGASFALFVGVPLDFSHIEGDAMEVRARCN